MICGLWLKEIKRRVGEGNGGYQCKKAVAKIHIGEKCTAKIRHPAFEIVR